MRTSLSIRILLTALILSACQTDYISPKDGSNEVTTPLKVNVKMLVGEILYENVDATVTVNGFDANNQMVWSKDFAFAGPDENILDLRKDLDHYSISTSKWGVSDTQTFTGLELSKNRADGQLPVTYVLGGKTSVVKKPAFVFTYFETSDNSFPIQSRSEYVYDDKGVIQRINYFEDYSSDATAQVISRYKIFTYSDKRLSTLISYNANNSKTAEDTYVYGVDGNLLRIDEANYSAALTSSMKLSFDNVSQRATASYQYSNGRGFDYQFTDQNKNLVSDNTTQAGEACNQGNYAYDRNINPFRHLGYVSYLVSDDYSINNRLAENVNYTACAFPTLVPVSYSYKYDELGYPTEKMTHYQGTTKTSAVKIYYKSFAQ